MSSPPNSCLARPSELAFVATFTVKANSAETAGKGMTSAEIMGQMTTFLLAGHETTATVRDLFPSEVDSTNLTNDDLSQSLSWTILTLAQNKSIQTKLREEAIQAMNRARSEGREELTSSELDGLPYLDAVTVSEIDLIAVEHNLSCIARDQSESLRLNPPVASTIRECFEDDVLPLAHPITLKNGQVVDHVPVSKGTTIFVPILPFNTAKEIWGPDADVFVCPLLVSHDNTSTQMSQWQNPERWIQGLPEETMERTKGGFTVSLLSCSKRSHFVPNLIENIAQAFARMLTFAGGPRSCIGYRFSVLGALWFSLTTPAFTSSSLMHCNKQNSKLFSLTSFNTSTLNRGIQQPKLSASPLW